MILGCFLHGVLGIGQGCRSHKSLYTLLTQDLWHLFHSLNPAQFGQRLRRLWEWGNPSPELPQVVLEKLAKLKTNAANFKLTFEDPLAFPPAIGWTDP